MYDGAVIVRAEKDASMDANGKNAGLNVVCLISDELLAFEFGIAYEVFGLPRPEFADGW